jgi:ribonuclease T2
VPQSFRFGPFRIATALIALLVVCAPLCAQKTGEPGKFDFYLLDMPWAPEFCSIADTSAQCQPPQRSFVVHGLWPQNNDGSYPVSCSHEQGPANPRENFDITPDMQLLGHEWAKHGTCSAQGPNRFFAMEHSAYASIHIPPAFDHVDREISMSPDEILAQFYKINPQLPQGSLVVSCRGNRFTAIEACFTTGLHPMQCRGVHSCAQPSLKIEPLPDLVQKKLRFAPAAASTNLL